MMRREYIRANVCGVIQVAAMLVLTGWLIWGAVPWHEAAQWFIPIPVYWACAATHSTLTRVLQWRRLRNEIRLQVPWESVRP